MNSACYDFIGVKRHIEGKMGAAFATGGHPMSATGHYGVACVGVPDSVTNNNGFKLGARVPGLVQKLQ
jgi:NAD(P)H dehydrogenase (quinone)